MDDSINRQAAIKELESGKDENNKRHVIYYPTGTVIVDER